MAWSDTRETRKGRRWYVFDRINGKIVTDGQGGYPTPRLAKEAEVAFEEKIRNKDYLKEGNNITLQNLTEKYVQHGVVNNMAKMTIRNRQFYFDRLIDFCPPKEIGNLGNRNIADISISNIDDFISHYSKKSTVNGLKIMMRTISGGFNYALNRNYINKNVVKNLLKEIKEEPVARFLNSEEIGKIYDACRFSPNRELEDIVTVALHTGMRKSEILNICASDIKDDHIFVESDMSFKTKTRKSRSVPINTAISHILYRVKSGRLFATWDHNRLGRSYGRAVKRAKIGRVRFHDLRHTFASTYLQKGGTVADLMLILGHSCVSTVMKYSHFQKAYLVSKINNVNYEIPSKLKVI